MVIYYLSKTTEKEEYLGTIQAFFALTTVISTFIRMSSGLLTIDHLSVILIGLLAILAGLLLANRIVDRLNTNSVQKFLYLVIGLSSLFNIISSFTR